MNLTAFNPILKMVRRLICGVKNGFEIISDFCIIFYVSFS
jgi:hypothetical protein